MTLGEKLRVLREARGWTQQELARRAHVRAALLSELETGKKVDTTGRVLRRLARVLKVSVDYLVDMSYDGPTDPRSSSGAMPRIDGTTLPLVTTS